MSTNEEENKNVETNEEEKQETKKVTRKRKTTPPKPKKLVHIDNFIEAIRIRIDLSDAQAKGFKAYMTGNHYAKSLNDFVPYLEKYIGKKVG